MLDSLALAKPESQAFAKPESFSIGLMSDADRRRRFQAFFREKLGSDRGKFLDRTHYTKGRLNQLLDPTKPFGEKAGREAARRLGLALDYFERDEHQALSPENEKAVSQKDDLEEVVKIWRALIPDQRAAILSELRKQHAFIEQVMEELKLRHLTSNVDENVLPPEFTRPAQRAFSIDEPEPRAQGKKRK